MRAALALIALSALCVTPAVAQGKTKTAPQAGVLVALEVCDLFASGNPEAEKRAADLGWDVSPADPESPYVETIDFYRDIAGLGYAEGYILMENYPDRHLGYCRIDVMDAMGEANVALINTMSEWQGETVDEGVGTYGAWTRSDEASEQFLLSHEDEYGFVLQLTIIRPNGGEAAN